MIAALSQNIALPNSMADIEAMAGVRALEFAHELGISEDIVEGDSQIIISILNSKVFSLASYGHLISDAKIFVDYFRYVSFSHLLLITLLDILFMS